jgi:Tfp pilus assembly protein PilX
MTERTPNVRSEGGWALVTALFAMAVLMVIGMTSLRIADFNSNQTRQHREREAALNLAEGVLLAQTFTLARQWPGPSKTAFPQSCSSAAATSGQCPNRETLAAANSSAPTTAAFRDLDVSEDSSWVTRVRDNYGALASAYYPASANGALTGSLGTCAAPCARDFNNDKAMWVQARAVVRGKVRNLAALMRMEQLSEAVPQTGLTAGALKITNNGNKPMVDATGSQVVVRCPVDVQLANQAVCTNFRGSQVTPLPSQKNPGNLMDLAQIDRFRDRAIIDGTYHAGCPSSLVGRVVFVENCQNPGNYNGTGASTCTPPAGLSPMCINTINQPGVLIVRCGALRMTGSWTYVGLLYFVNGSDGSCPGHERGSNPPSCSSNSLDSRSVLDSQGGFGVWGGLAADGNACVLLGSNGMQLRFDINAFSAVSSYGTVGLVQNTWRELPAGAS